MKIKAAVLSVVLLIASAVLLSAQAPVKYEFRNIKASASSIGGSLESLKLILSGSAHIETVDKATKTTFEADASKITTTFFSAKIKAQGLGAVKNATMQGRVKLVYVTVDASGNPVKTTATADKATYDGADRLAHLTGNVKIVSENPAVFAEPAVMTGDTAVVNLKPNLGPDEMRFRVESSPGQSTIEVTPAAKPKK